MCIRDSLDSVYLSRSKKPCEVLVNTKQRWSIIGCVAPDTFKYTRAIVEAMSGDMCCRFAPRDHFTIHPYPLSSCKRHVLPPLRNLSAPLAACRPSAMAHTTNAVSYTHLTLPTS